MPIRTVHKLGVTTLTFSCLHVAQTLPSRVFMTARTSASRLPADTRELVKITEVFIGSGLWKTTESDLVTPRLSQKPGRPIVKSTVELRLSNMVEAAPPWRLPSLLHMNLRTRKLN